MPGCGPELESHTFFAPETSQETVPAGLTDPTAPVIVAVYVIAAPSVGFDG